VRPTTLEGLHLISGVGEAKLTEFGQDVLDIVARLTRDLGLSTDNPIERQPAPSPRMAPTAAAEGAFPYFRAGQSVAEVARRLDRAESTVRGYLCEYIEAERPEHINAWVDQELQTRIITAARQHGSERLKPVFLALNQEVPYDAIRLVLTYLNSRSDPSASI
jgi:ATP-dependent DNA helicase RecQ